MSRRLFLRIANVVEAHNSYFKQRTNALGVLGLSCLQKVTAAHRILAYGIVADLTDEYLQIGESIMIESLRAFVKAIVEVFGDWKWEKCLIAWHGMYTGHCREPTIILEAVASQDLWL